MLGKVEEDRVDEVGGLCYVMELMSASWIGLRNYLCAYVV